VGDTRGHVILCGLEGLSIRTLEELERLGIGTTLLVPPAADAAHPDAARRALAERLAERVVEGDPRDPSVLESAGITRASALVLSADDDVGNIHAALVAARLALGLHIVIRTFDEDFGRRVEALVPGSVTLSASAVAAPGFVSALLEERDERTIEVAGHRLALRPADPADPATVVTLIDDRRGRTVVLPDPAAVAPGSLPGLVDEGSAARPAARKRRRRASGPRAWSRRIDARFWVLGGVLAAITVASAVVFELAQGISPIDALYATVAGFFGAVDPDVAATPALKAFAVLLTLVGAAALAMFYALIADAVLSARLRDLLGPRPEGLRDHVVIVGLGSIGFRVARALREMGVPLVAAERQADGRFVESARDLGIPVVIGDAGQPGLLRSLGVERARALLAATDQDAANLATALHARGLRDDLRIVVRLFDPGLAEQLEAALGAYHSRSVSALAAPAFAAAAIARTVIATLPVGHHRVLVVARVTVAPGSLADGSTIGAEEAAASAIPDGAARILAVSSSSGVAWRPGPDHRLAAGDEVALIAPRRSLAVTMGRTAAGG
jgi:Trk K+ transport system NAD-binding subunit